MPLLFPLCGPRGCRRDPYPLTEHSPAGRIKRTESTAKLPAREWSRPGNVKRKEERKEGDDSLSLSLARPLSEFLPFQVGLARRERLSDRDLAIIAGRIKAGERDEEVHGR